MGVKNARYSSLIGRNSSVILALAPRFFLKVILLLEDSEKGSLRGFIFVEF